MSHHILPSTRERERERERERRGEKGGGYGGNEGKVYLFVLKMFTDMFCFMKDKNTK